MKTLEEVKAHVDKVGYNQLAIQKIEGFLLGCGLLGKEFEMEYMIGERDFDDFKTWFNSEEKTKQEIDWSEFGFGDFIHVQDGIDVMLLGDVCDGKLVGFDSDRVRVLALTSESRPCDEIEIDKFYSVLRKKGILFASGFGEFSPTQSSICENKQNANIDFQELDKSYEELCRIAESMSEDNPCKGMAKAIVEMVGAMVDDVKESTKNDSESIDMLEIDAKEAIENIIANIHAGTLEEKEKHNVIAALKGLVELGGMYE